MLFRFAQKPPYWRALLGLQQLLLEIWTGFIAKWFILQWAFGGGLTRKAITLLAQVLPWGKLAYEVVIFMHVLSIGLLENWPGFIAKWIILQWAFGGA